MEKTYRNERKFILSNFEAEIIRSDISASCFLDKHVNQKGFYDIKSIYFDTLSDKFLYETLNGENLRHKYRVRRYGDLSEFFRLEKKIAENGLKYKQMDSVTNNQLLDMLSGRICQADAEGKSVLSDFTTEHMLFSLRPVAVIGYRRIPYVYPIGNVRITFDSNIVVSDDMNTFFSGFRGVEKQVLPNAVVLEVKYDDVLPHFIRMILNRSGVMEQSAFSKYAMSRLKLFEGTP